MLCSVEALQQPEARSGPEGAAMAERAGKLPWEVGQQREVAPQHQPQRGHKAEEAGEGQPVPRKTPKGGRTSHKQRSKLDELQILQSELSFVNARASGACARLKRKVETRCQSHLDRRRAIIQRIPGFWAKVVSLAVCPQAERHPAGGAGCRRPLLKQGRGRLGRGEGVAEIQGPWAQGRP